MRITVYSQELTSEINVVEKESNTGLVYTGIQMMLHSSPMLHPPPLDDDRSCVTIWLPRSASRREELAITLEELAITLEKLAITLEEMAAEVRKAKPETGLDLG